MGIFHSRVELQVPISKLYFDTNEFRFNWNDVNLAVPYDKQPLKIEDGHLLELFKKYFEGEITISFRWHRIHHRVDEMKVHADTSVHEEIDRIMPKVNSFISEMKTRIESGILSQREAQRIASENNLRVSNEMINRLLTGVTKGTPDERSTVELQCPLSELYYDASGFWFKWNSTWLAMPYERISSDIRYGYLLEVFKDNFKTEISIRIRWDRVFQNIIDIQPENGNNERNEISVMSRRIGECVGEIHSLVKEGALSFEQAKAIFMEKGLECDDKRMQEVLSEIIDRMEMHTEPKFVDIPLRDIEYGYSGINFHWQGTPFQVDEEGIPFEAGPAIEEIKGQLEGYITVDISRDCITKWDRGNSVLLIGDVRTGMGQVEISPETVKSFKDLRIKLICDAISALEKETISIEQVQSILRGWGLSLVHQEICQKIADSIPPWEVELHIQMPASEVEYKDEEIIVASKQGKKIAIPSEELQFGTSGVLEGIKRILEGNINVIVRYSGRFEWDTSQGRLELIEGDKTYDVTVDDEFLDGLDFVNAQFVYPSGDETVPGPRDIRTWGIPTRSGYYNIDCVRYLKAIVENTGGSTYITSVDLWYKVGDVLIWERPEYSAATYIFYWPDIPLKKFIHTTWSTPLESTRRHRDKSKYIDRVIHDHDYGLGSWKEKLNDIIEEYADI
jgi:hypothetical protein